MFPVILTYPYTLYPVVVVSPPKNSSSMALRRSSGNCGPKPSLRWTPNQWGSKEHDGPKAFQQNSSNTNKSTKQVKDSTQAPFEPHYPRKTKLPVKKHGWNPHLIEWMFQLLSITTPLASRMLATVTPVIDIVPEVTNMTLEKQPWMKMYLLLKKRLNFQCHVSFHKDVSQNKGIAKSLRLQVPHVFVVPNWPSWLFLKTGGWKKSLFLKMNFYVPQFEHGDVLLASSHLSLTRLTPTV